MSPLNTECTPEPEDLGIGATNGPPPTGPQRNAGGALGSPYTPDAHTKGTLLSLKSIVCSACGISPVVETVGTVGPGVYKQMRVRCPMCERMSYCDGGTLNIKPIEALEILWRKWESRNEVMTYPKGTPCSESMGAEKKSGGFTPIGIAGGLCVCSAGDAGPPPGVPETPEREEKGTPEFTTGLLSEAEIEALPRFKVRDRYLESMDACRVCGKKPVLHEHILPGDGSRRQVLSVCSGCRRVVASPIVEGPVTPAECIEAGDDAWSAANAPIALAPPELKGLMCRHYEEPWKLLGVPQNYPFLSSGYCEELCLYIKELKAQAAQVVPPGPAEKVAEHAMGLMPREIPDGMAEKLMARAAEVGSQMASRVNDGIEAMITSLIVEGYSPTDMELMHTAEFAGTLMKEKFWVEIRNKEDG